MPSGKAKVAGILGWPVAHSLSPRLHNHWLAHYGIDGAYVPLPVKSDDLAGIIRVLPKMGFRGFNLTIPHKETIVPLLDSVEETARIIGAVNTVTVDEQGKLHGSNTDAYGFIESIRSRLPARKSKVVIVGAGGAARAVCYALVQAGFTEIIVVNRTLGRAKTLAADFIQVTAEPWDQRSRLLEGAGLLVNATSLGLSGNESLAIDLALLPRDAVVTDIVYRPLITPLLEKARARGHTIVDGLGMLIHQAAPGFNAWFGVMPEITDDLGMYLLKE